MTGRRGGSLSYFVLLLAGLLTACKTWPTTPTDAAPDAAAMPDAADAAAAPDDGAADSGVSDGDVPD